MTRGRVGNYRKESFVMKRSRGERPKLRPSGQISIDLLTLFETQWTESSLRRVILELAHPQQLTLTTHICADYSLEPFGVAELPELVAAQRIPRVSDCPGFEWGFCMNPIYRCENSQYSDWPRMSILSPMLSMTIRDTFSMSPVFCISVLQMLPFFMRQLGVIELFARPIC